MPRPCLRLILALVAAAAVMLPTAAVADAKPLKRGSHGARVVKLQQALHITPADGVFGPGTVRAVKRWQRRHHLDADGVVGAATWRMVRRARAARRSSARLAGIVVRSSGPSVRLLQRHLGIAADGIFGPGTARAVRTFQRTRGLTVDGIVGPGTWGALGVSGVQPVLKRRGSRAKSAEVTMLQRAISAANRIARLPYRYGGGHGSFDDTGYDCSGSVSYVLHAIGMLSAPLDSGALMSYGSPGPGRYITVYASPGHAYMIIGGRRFDTTGRAEDGTRWDSRTRSSAGYVVRHPPGL